MHILLRCQHRPTRRYGQAFQVFRFSFVSSIRSKAIFCGLGFFSSVPIFLVFLFPGDFGKRTMASCLRVCLQSTLKILNSVIGLLGMAMIMYSLWMIRTCLQQVCEFSRGFSESSSSSSWFIFTFLGLGIFLCVLTCSGHIAAETINNHCLSCYAAVLFCLLLLEAAITADIFLNGHWEEAFPRDPTGRFNQFKEFVRSNSGLGQWIGLLIVAVQALSIFLSMVLRAIGPEHRVYDDSDDDSLPATLPLLKSQAHITHAADRKFQGRNDSWIVRIRDTVGR